MNSNNDAVIEFLLNQLRQQLANNPVDVMGEVKRWGIDRSIVGRGIYTDEENAIIDAYIGLERNPYKQQCEDLAHEVQSLKNQLRDASARVAELHLALVKATGDAEAYKLVRKGEHGPEQSGCRKEGAPECGHEWRTETLYGARVVPTYCRKCGVYKQKDEKNDAQECEHKWCTYTTTGGTVHMCRVCGLKK